MSGGFADQLRELEQKRRSKLASKLPSWTEYDIEVPDSLIFQQCSSEVTARYKASLAGEGLRVADLTGGLGADAWAFSLCSRAVWYNERNVALRACVERNFASMGIKNVAFNKFEISPEATDWKQALKGFAPDLIYLDPARRDASGKKIFLLEECSPDVLSLMPLLLEMAPKVMVKVSPMADLTMLRRRLEGVLSALHVVGAEGECKEILCLCSKRPSGEPRVVLYENGHSFSGTYGPEETPGEEKLLFVPSAALTKSGLGPEISTRTFDEELAHFGKFFRIVEDIPFSSSAIKTLGRRYPQAEVTARGVRVSSDELRRRMGLRPGGQIHIFACTIGSERRLVVCSSLTAPAGA